MYLTLCRSKCIATTNHTKSELQSMNTFHKQHKRWDWQSSANCWLIQQVHGVFVLYYMNLYMLPGLDRCIAWHRYALSASIVMMFMYFWVVFMAIYGSFVWRHSRKITRKWSIASTAQCTIHFHFYTTVVDIITSRDTTKCIQKQDIRSWKHAIGVDPHISRKQINRNIA